MICSACGLVYLDPQPRQAVRERYLADYDLAEHFAPWEGRKRVRTDAAGKVARGLAGGSGR